MPNYFNVGPLSLEATYPQGVFEINDLDVSTWIGIHDVVTIGGAWTPTRIAANDIVLRKTAADNTTHIFASLRNIMRHGVVRGYRISYIDVIYGIATADLEGHALTLSTVTYAHETAVAVAAAGGTISGTLAVGATGTDPRVTRLTLGSPIISIAALQDLRIELEVNAAATSVYDFYGFIVGAA